MNELHGVPWMMADEIGRRPTAAAVNKRI